jgi:hypothetical protein
MAARKKKYQNERKTSLTYQKQTKILFLYFHAFFIVSFNIFFSFSTQHTKHTLKKINKA